ncbi:hypothetical protein PAXRUDRAFT_774550 [Paxillus rubicundulus Ve08.2h10]|uniref:Uncharacterized protein n=1 Tax=Paxillus rubicundulus Ve08.2h10 TaxID=930991 RepID=A0A0D0DJ41_9AGAM|nr:hypothetical protein PAXRUDRAFT_774550 [Paxillus rubicundulus Ve08.2h10]
MEATTSNYKWKASELGEDLPAPGLAPPQPQPFNPLTDSDVKSDGKPSIVDDKMERGMIYNGAYIDLFFFMMFLMTLLSLTPRHFLH